MQKGDLNKITEKKLCFNKRNKMKILTYVSAENYSSEK